MHDQDPPNSGPTPVVAQEAAPQPSPTIAVTPELVTEGVARVAPEGAQNPSAEDHGQGPKSIFLFSDGTGNSSAKLFKTNVWRMYEALDLGQAPPGQPVQIAYYDNGVGTSNFRPLRLLGGIFGIGLKANVLRLYKFLCSNYVPGDRIYAFGFSRGAFTIRLLVHLIADQGVIALADPPGYLLHDALRNSCRDIRPNRWPRWLARSFKAVRNGLVAIKRRLFFQLLRYTDIDRHPTDIEFVGVWDTVAAYGGPFAEVTRGIDDWVWPLTMPDYGLSPRVRKACHALSLDDERDAFQPLLWDEYDEQLKVAANLVAEDRLQQVWFSGVHSDVGGGYPDESLSYVSLLWMMDELEGVRFIPHFAEVAAALANPFGPIHDSRAGFAAYYRYQPRKIAAMLDPADPRYRSMRDPQIGKLPDSAKEWPDEDKRRWKRHGLLRHVKIHDSAVARIINGIDNYAPAALPEGFKIVPGKGPRGRAWLTQAEYQMLNDARQREPDRIERQERVWNWVWWRRLTYFATVALSLHLVLLPKLPWMDGIDHLCSDDRCYAGTILGKISYFLPATAEKLWAQYLTKPFALIVGVIALLILLAIGKFAERRFRAAIKNIWQETLKPAAPSPRDAGSGLRARLKALWCWLRNQSSVTLRSFRESGLYQWPLYWLKWRLLPLIFGVAILLSLLIALALVATHATYAIAEPRQAFCADRKDGDGDVQTPHPIPFSAASPCTDLKVNVKKDNLYKIRLTDVRGWDDGGKPNPLSGWIGSYHAEPDRGLVQSPRLLKWAWPFNRVTKANYYQPLTEVRTHWGGVREFLLGPNIDMRIARFKPAGGGYEMYFCPQRDGHLYMMLNDAGFAYFNNGGTAELEVLHLVELHPPLSCASYDPLKEYEAKGG